MTMTPSSTSTSLSSRELKQSLDLVEIKPGLCFGRKVLKDMLPDVETVLFFGKVYGLDAAQLGALLLTVLETDLAIALFGEGGYHSNELQDYLLDGYYDDDLDEYIQAIVPPAEKGQVVLTDKVVPKGEILPEVWKQLEVEVASSIQAVADKLAKTVNMLPGKQGQMMFQTMMKMNAKRPVLGDHKAFIHHPPQKENLLILDDSGSMSRETVEKIVGDVVALSYMANAHFVRVSNTATYWEPGTYDVPGILARSEFGGTHYETLADVLQRDWGVVITVADYDSSPAAKKHIATYCTGHVDEVIDISLVNRPTFLAECVGQLAAKVRPMLIGNSQYVIESPRWEHEKTHGY